MRDIKILIVEDDELFAESLEDFLSQEGFIIEVANSAESASDLYYEKSFDLLLLDINMPKTNGFELLSSIRKSNQNTPAIFITSYRDKKSIESGFLSGCDDFMSKPIDLDELKLRIMALLKRSNKLKESLYINGLEYKIDEGEIGGVHLKRKEKRLLNLLIEYKNQTISKDLIFQRVWDWNEEPSSASLRVYINTLKKILPPNSITNYKGIGYKLELKE